MRSLVLGMIFILYLVNYADKAILGLDCRTNNERIAFEF